MRLKNKNSRKFTLLQCISQSGSQKFHYCNVALCHVVPIRSENRLRLTIAHRDESYIGMRLGGSTCQRFGEIRHQNRWDGNSESLVDKENMNMFQRLVNILKSIYSNG
jgi:hypothetical protein